MRNCLQHFEVLYRLRLQTDAEFTGITCCLSVLFSGDGGEESAHWVLGVQVPSLAPSLSSPTKGSRCQQFAADVLHELTVLLSSGADREPVGVSEECTSTLLALSHAVPDKHVGKLLVALADRRRPEPSLADAMLLPDLQRVVMEAGKQRW